MKMILTSGKKNLLRDMTDLKTTQTAFSLNVQSIRAYHEQLSFLIESFENKPALIGLTQTWLSDNDPFGICFENLDNLFYSYGVIESSFFVYCFCSNF